MPFLSRFTLQDPSWLQRISETSGTEARKRLLAWILVLASYLLTAQIGIYLYHDIGTSPALIWPPVGIALAAVLIEGYWIGSAIAVGALLNAILSGAPAFIVIGAVIANTAQPLIGGLILRKLRFNSLLNSLRDVFLIITVSLTVTFIAPLLNYSFALIYNYFAAVDRVLPAWPQLWIGGALSALVLTPFLSRWIGHDLAQRTRSQQLELVVSVFLVSVVSYILFATAVPTYLSTTLLLVLFGSLFWISFRVGPRAMSLALLLLTSISLAGAIYGVHMPTAPDNSLASRLLSTEIFDLILAFFFFILVSVEEQRKEALKNLSLDAERLASALETIRAEDSAKNEFIATLAHELRNPLAPVLSALELLRMQEDDPDRKEILESAERQSVIMRRLLDELLDVARIARRAVVLKKEAVLLQQVLKESVDAVRHFYRDRELEFTNTIPAEEIYIDGDPVRLAQIFTNILYNAGKYTPDGGKISLSLEKKDAKAVVEIKDTGIGITKEMLARIFEPFVQDARRAEVGSGLGIGLSIAKRLTELHAGTVSATSEGKDKGSVFVVELPIHAKPVLKTEETKSTESVQSSVLVVDDNEDAANSIAKLLRARGNTVDTVFTGKDAIEAVSKKPHYVLLDIGLPDMAGHVVAKKIHERHPEAIVIALSGYGSQEDKLTAKEVGIAVHLTKPASLKDIEDAMMRSKKEF
jgi:signal transduction histidine kinase/CheY-like chemotaxis protein